MFFSVSGPSRARQAETFREGWKILFPPLNPDLSIFLWGQPGRANGAMQTAPQARPVAGPVFGGELASHLFLLKGVKVPKKDDANGDEAMCLGVKHTVITLVGAAQSRGHFSFGSMLRIGRTRRRRTWFWEEADAIPVAGFERRSSK
ncbi:MAG: hypothetical protein V1918_01975 [Planctomycetota bacterium]